MTLYVDGVQQTVVTANKVGDYSAVVSLGEIAGGQRRTVTAETDGGNGKITAEKVVVYRPDEPVLESVTFRHSSTQEFTGNSGASGARYPMTFVPGRGMDFSVKFDEPELIDTVYVVSRRGREEKIIVCKYDPSTDTFTGTGYFDASNPNYVPGDFTVEYIPKAEPLDYTNGFDYTSQEKFNELPESWQNAEVTVVENSGTTTDLSFKIPEANGSETTFRAVSKTAPIPSNLTQENAAQQGYIATTDAKGKQAFARVYEKDGGLVTEMVDFAAGNIVQSVIEKVISGGKEISGKVFALKAVSMYSDLGASMDDYHEIWSDIYNSDLSTDEQAALMGDLGVAVLAHAGLSMLQAVALVGFFAVGIAASSFALPAMAALGVVSFTIGLFQGNIKSWMGRKMYAKQTEFALRTKWYIDPSGYVYDNQTQEVIPGATVTVHWIPYDGTDASYWSEKPGADVYGEVWDASEYSQFNPLKTDDFGHYAWDVPEGWWRVKCEKEGYETVWSDWLPVPPPQTEVHLGMTSLAAVPGDINGDGKRNNRDVTRLLQYLAGWEVQVVEARLDINGDGKLTNRDVTRLLQYLAGWNVEIY